MALAGGAAGVGWARPSSKALVAVYPPWWSQERIWRAAVSIGAVEGGGGAPFVLLIRPAAGDAVRRAAGSGALFTLEPGGLGLCGSSLKDAAR